MTTLDKINNDYQDHKGQEKLRLQPKLVTDIQFLSKNQNDLFRNIAVGNNSYFTELDTFLSNTMDDVNNTLGMALHVDKNTGNNATAGFAERKNANIKPLGGSIDGAAFIYVMNVYMQLAYIEKYIFNNLPKEVRIKYLTDLINVKDLMHAFLKTLQEVLSISTYNPKYTQFNTFGIKLGLTKHKVSKPLDKPVKL